MTAGAVFKSTMTDAPKAGASQMMPAYFAYTEAMMKAGVLLAGDRLAATSTATTVRSPEGKTKILNGPYAETKEQLGGYYLIEAKDLNDALAVAARIPSARIGTIEVRPIMAF